jgi:hypothetical protein
LEPEDSLIVALLVDCLVDVRQLRDYLNSKGGVIDGRNSLKEKPLLMLRAREKDAREMLSALGVGRRARALILRGQPAQTHSLAAQLARYRLNGHADDPDDEEPLN